MPHRNALIFLFQPSQIDRSNPDDPFSALPWDEIDVLFTALIGDLVKNACQLIDVDVLLYRNPQELSDDFFLPFRQRMQLFDSDNTPFNKQIQQIIEDTFHRGYQNVVIILDNHPLITRKYLRRVYDQLTYEDDCVVLGPTFEGKCYLVGMKMNHGGIFDSQDGDPIKKPNLLLKNICNLDSMLFLLDPLNSLDSSKNLLSLMLQIETLNKTGVEFPAKTYSVFKMLDKKYRLKKAFQ